MRKHPVPLMIIEGIITTLNEDGSVNVAPQGPIVDSNFTSFHLRPYRGSTTYVNLMANRPAVFHVTDDVLLIAQTAIGKLKTVPITLKDTNCKGAIMADCCRWYELEILKISPGEQKAAIDSRVINQGSIRDFFGFNRAKHAVIEAAILATRVHLFPSRHIIKKMEELCSPVEKTGGDQEHLAFNLIKQFIDTKIAQVDEQ